MPVEVVGVVVVDTELDPVVSEAAVEVEVEVEVEDPPMLEDVVEVVTAAVVTESADVPS